MRALRGSLGPTISAAVHKNIGRCSHSPVGTFCWSRLVLTRNYSQCTKSISSNHAKRKHSSQLCGSNKENWTPTSDMDRPIKKLRGSHVEENKASAIDRVRESYQAVETSLRQAIKVNHEACERVILAIQHQTSD